MITLAQNLRTAREANNLMQKEVADKLGITKGEISHYETGRAVPPTHRLAAIAQLYGTTVDNLID